MQLFSKNLIKKRLPGSIVNISSIVGQIGFDELASYGSSKGALISLTKCFAVEMSKKILDLIQLALVSQRHLFISLLKQKKKKTIFLDLKQFLKKGGENLKKFQN